MTFDQIRVGQTIVGPSRLEYVVVSIDGASAKLKSVEPYYVHTMTSRGGRCRWIGLVVDSVALARFTEKKIPNLENT